MAWVRLLPAALVSLSLASIAVPIGAQAAAVPAPIARHAHSGRRTLLLHRRVPAAGIYEVRVAVTARARGHRQVVRLQIGWHRRLIQMTGRHRRVRFGLRLAIRGHVLTVRATSRQRAAGVLIRLARLRTSVSTAPRSATAPQPSAGSSVATNAIRVSSPAGVTGPVGATGRRRAGATGPIRRRPLLDRRDWPDRHGRHDRHDRHDRLDQLERPTGTTGATGATGATGSTANRRDRRDRPRRTARAASSWRPMVFDDEFNGTTLDTTKWSTGWFGSGITAPITSGELECYDPAQVVDGGGELDLNLIARSETCGGQTRPYASGDDHDQRQVQLHLRLRRGARLAAGRRRDRRLAGVWADGRPGRRTARST